MPTVSAGATGTATFSGASTVAITLDTAERAIVRVVTSGGVVQYDDNISTSRDVGPFADGAGLSVTAIGGAVVYTVSAYTAPSTGDGLPSGGTTGQVLAKASGDDGDAEWVNAGAGDLLAANNLSDVASAATARENLGLEIGADVQAYSANLAEYAAVNPTAAGLALLDDADGAAQLATMAGAAATGSGGVVRATSPTLVTPDIGTPSAGVLSSCTAYPATALVAPTPVTLSSGTSLVAGTHGSRLLICDTAATHTIEDDTSGAWGAGSMVYGVNTSAGIVTIAADSTGTTNTVTADQGMTLTVPPGQQFTFYRTAANAWRGGSVDTGLQINSRSAAYTTVFSDRNKTILHPTADNNARTFTIDSNANVAYPEGTTLTFVNQINTVTIAITSDTMTLAGAGTTGSRTLAANGIATALKIAATSWVINGTGLT